MPDKTEDDRIVDESEKKKKIEENLQITHNKILRTLRDRKRFEEEYGNIIKGQKEYWKSQLDNTNSETDKRRYNELKENIKREDNLLKQIKEEIGRINNELEMEKEHEKQDEKRKNKF